MSSSIFPISSLKLSVIRTRGTVDLCVCSLQYLEDLEFNRHILRVNVTPSTAFHPLNAELNPICNLLALLGAHHILHVSRIMVNLVLNCLFMLTH